MEGKIRVLLDLTDFHGWADLSAARTHFGFVKDHIHKVERIGVIASKHWQHWIAAVVSTFVPVEEKCFDAAEADEAKSWITA